MMMSLDQHIFENEVGFTDSHSNAGAEVGGSAPPLITGR